MQGKESDSADAAVQVLQKTAADFARADEFLRVLAITRWAKQNGATLSASGVKTYRTRNQTPDTVITSYLGEWIAGGPAPGSWTSDCKSFKAHFAAGMRSLPRITSTYEHTRQEMLQKSIEKITEKVSCDAPSAVGN